MAGYTRRITIRRKQANIETTGVSQNAVQKPLFSAAHVTKKHSSEYRHRNNAWSEQTDSVTHQPHHKPNWSKYIMKRPSAGQPKLWAMSMHVYKLLNQSVGRTGQLIVVFLGVFCIGTKIVIPDNLGFAQRMYLVRYASWQNWASDIGISRSI